MGCRLEANYGFQCGVDMVPLMMQENYKAKGWLGLILGTRLWYPFFGAEGDGAAAFEKRVDAVVRAAPGEFVIKCQPRYKRAQTAAIVSIFEHI